MHESCGERKPQHWLMKHWRTPSASDETLAHLLGNARQDSERVMWHSGLSSWVSSCVSGRVKRFKQTCFSLCQWWHADTPHCSHGVLIKCNSFYLFLLYIFTFLQTLRLIQQVFSYLMRTVERPCYFILFLLVVHLILHFSIHNIYSFRLWFYILTYDALLGLYFV